jgi:hypothetical protein
MELLQPGVLKSLEPQPLGALGEAYQLTQWKIVVRHRVGASMGPCRRAVMVALKLFGAALLLFPRLALKGSER